jgi:acyl carrier protein
MLDSTLLRIFADVLRVKNGAVNVEAAQDNTPEWDSMAHLRLILQIEEEFGIRFKTAEIPDLTSIAMIRQSLAGHGCE